ncbi:MAG: TrkA family potassium uptake protein [Thermodesulfobacteriota bacterium]
MKVLIIGGGKTLYFLCRRFISRGYRVVIINRSREECLELSRSFSSATVICGDGSDPDILRESGAMEANVVLALTPSDPDNLVICQLSSLQFGVPRVIALANDPDNAEAFEKLGVSCFSLSPIIGSLIEQRAAIEQITNLLPVDEGRVNVTEIVLDERSPVAGKQLRDLTLPQNALVAFVIRDNVAIIPRGSNELRVGDRVVLMTLPENHGPVLKAFTGERI